MNNDSSRFFHGSITGQIQEDDSIRARITAPLTLSRDTNGTWLVYATLNAHSWDDDATSKELTITDPTACRAFDALFELIADPVEFKGVTIEEPARLDDAAAD